MKIITTRDLIKNVATRWYNQYFGAEFRGSRKDVFDRLNNLDTDTCSARDVDNIIGNDDWTELKCENCNKIFGAVIEIDTDNTGEDGAAKFCFNCIKEAYEKMKGR